MGTTHRCHHSLCTHLKRRTLCKGHTVIQPVHGNNQVLILQRCQPVSTHSVHHAVKMTHLKRRTKLSFRIPLQRTHRHTACTTVRVHGNNQVLILQRCQPVSTHSVHHAVKMTHLKRRTKLSFRIPLQRTHRHTACTSPGRRGNKSGGAHPPSVTPCVLTQCMYTLSNGCQKYARHCTQPVTPGKDTPSYSLYEPG